MPLTTGEPPRDGIDGLVAMLRDMQRQIDQLQRRSSLANTGLTALGPGSVQVDGSIQSANWASLTAGWKFDGTQLEANTGVIGNGALANPIAASTSNPSATNFALTTSFVTLATASVPVPAGFTTALVHLTGGLYAVNPNTTGGSNGTGGDSINIQVGTLPGYGSYVYSQPLSGSNGFSSAHADVAFKVLSLTPGSSITVNLYGASSYQGMTANTTNKASASASIIWFR